MPVRVFQAERKDVKLGIGLVTRLMTRWSCSTMLLIYLTLTNHDRDFPAGIDLIDRYFVALLLFIVTFSGTSGFRMILSKKHF